MLDRIYFWEQESVLKYYEWKVASQTYLDSVANLYLAGSHSERNERQNRSYEIIVSQFTYNSVDEFTHSYTKSFNNEDQEVTLAGIYQNSTNTREESPYNLYDPHQLYIVYFLPYEGNRGKILRLQIDTPLEDTVRQATIRPVTYYFMPPIEFISANGQTQCGGFGDGLWKLRINNFQYNRKQDTFYFAGRTNYIEGADDSYEHEVFINWSCDPYEFGYINYWTPN